MKTYDIRLNNSLFDYTVNRLELAMGTWAVRRDADRICEQVAMRICDAAPAYWQPVTEDGYRPSDQGIHPLIEAWEDAFSDTAIGAVQPERMRELILAFEVASLDLIEAIDKHDRWVAFHPVQSRHLAAAC